MVLLVQVWEQLPDRGEFTWSETGLPAVPGLVQRLAVEGLIRRVRTQPTGKAVWRKVLNPRNPGFRAIRSRLSRSRSSLLLLGEQISVDRDT